MSPNGASQLSRHIGNEVANLIWEDMWHCSHSRIDFGFFHTLCLSCLSHSLKTFQTISAKP
ncbi:hypothetical protein Hanom_Chr05g00464771 [Helianthus anomalus]